MSQLAMIEGLSQYAARCEKAHAPPPARLPPPHTFNFGRHLDLRHELAELRLQVHIHAVLSEVEPTLADSLERFGHSIAHCRHVLLAQQRCRLLPVTHLCYLNHVRRLSKL